MATREHSHYLREFAMQRWFARGAALGCVAVAMGAFGAHGLPNWLEAYGLSATDIPARLETFETAVRYQMYASLSLIAFALASERYPHRCWTAALITGLAGAIVFCGALYGLVIASGWLRPVLGMTAPLGGSLMIASWALAAWSAARSAAEQEQAQS